MNNPIVIAGAARTPMGAFQGDSEGIEHGDVGNRLMAGQGHELI